MRVVTKISVVLVMATVCFIPQAAHGYINNAIISWGDCCLVYGPGTDTAFDSPEGIARVMARWKVRGYTGVYWRSDLGDYEPNQIIRFHGSPLEPMIDLAIRRSVEDTSARMDVLTVAREAAEAEGLQFWVYHPTIYSDGAPPWVVQPGYMPWSFVHRYVYEHNDVLTIDRNGKKQYLVREYAYPGARADKVAEYTYMAQKWGIKNFLISMRTEAAQTEPGPIKADQYGFNQPIVDEMLAQYGVNILTDPRFDINNPAWDTTDPMVQNWHRLRGSYLTQLYRELRQALHVIDPAIRLAIAVPGDYAGPDLGNWVLDWRTWINEGLINEVVQPVTLQAGWDSTVGKGYLCDLLNGIGRLDISVYRNYINSSNHPETKLIQAGAYEMFQPTPLPPEADGWQTFWAMEAFDIAWYNRWHQWKEDLADFGYIKFVEQNFDGFQVNSPGYTGAEGDARYHPELRACPGGWCSFGDGTDAKPLVQNTVSRSGNAIKLTYVPDSSGNLYVRHTGGVDHETFQYRVDNLISNGTYTLEFWLYRADINSGISVFPQYDRYTDTGLSVGLNVSSGSALGAVKLFNSGTQSWLGTTYYMPVGQWQKFTLEVNVDAKTYKAYAGANREITLRPMDTPYTTATNCFSRVIFVPNSSSASNVCYLDDVVWKWTPKLYYTHDRIHTYLADDIESHTIDSTLNGKLPMTGGAWNVSPAGTASGFFAENMLSFGDGYLSLAATSNNNAFIYSNANVKLRLDADETVTVDFDVFLRNGYQSIVGLQKNITGNFTAAVNPNVKWKCWNGNQYTTTDVNVARDRNFDLWHHVQMILNCASKNYKVIVQPCGSLPTLLGTFAWDSGTVADDEVFFVIKPQGTNGQVTYYDNIRVTYGPNCPTGDLNNDCEVDFADFAKLAFNWMQFDSIGNLNTDKIVNFKDVQVLGQHWLENEN